MIRLSAGGRSGELLFFPGHGSCLVSREVGLIRRSSCLLAVAALLSGPPGLQSIELETTVIAQVKPLPAPKLPEPPPSSPAKPSGGAGAGRDAPNPQAGSGGAPEELKGLKVVNFSSQRASWEGASASDIVSGDPNKVWASSDGNFPQSFVLELPIESTIAYVVFNNQSRGDPKRSSKDVEILVSTQSASFGFEVAAKAALQQGEIGQGIELKPARRARWVRIRILSNHGSPEMTTLGIVQVLGRQ